MTPTPNQALQRTRLRVTAPASTATFPPTAQVPRRSGVSLSLRSLGDFKRPLVPMRAFLSLGLFISSLAFAADQPMQATLDATKAMIAKVQLGMTRTEVEAILGPDWKFCVSAGWASGQHVTYWNTNFPGHDIVIHYDWMGRRGIGRRSTPTDPVIQLPVLKPRLQRPSK